MLASLAAISLAGFYATYVITRSDFPPVEWLRVKVFEIFNEGSTPAYLATCPWCVGFYATGVATLLVNQVDDLHLPVLMWIAAAGVNGLLADLHDTMVSYTMKAKN